MINSYSII